MLVLLLVLVVGCGGGSSFRCVCQDDHMHTVELSNWARGMEPPAALPARAGAELCRDVCDHIPPP
jgi:hypothetical protein